MKARKIKEIKAITKLRRNDLGREIPASKDGEKVPSGV